MSSNGNHPHHSSEKLEDGPHTTRIESTGAVIDEVTGEEIEPVVTLKTWIVVLVSQLQSYSPTPADRDRSCLAVMVFHSGPFL